MDFYEKILTADTLPAWRDALRAEGRTEVLLVNHLTEFSAASIKVPVGSLLNYLAIAQ